MKILLLVTIFIFGCSNLKTSSTDKDLESKYGSYWHKVENGLEHFDLTVLEAPAGLAKGERKIIGIFKGENADLVIITYESVFDNEVFAKAYNYFKHDKIIDPLSPPERDNWAELYRPAIHYNKSKKQFKLQFSECVECGSSSRFSIIAEYGKDFERWDWVGRVVTDISADETGEVYEGISQ